MFLDRFQANKVFKNFVKLIYPMFFHLISSHTGLVKRKVWTLLFFLEDGKGFSLMAL